MLPSIRLPLLACLVLGATGTLAAQSTALSPSPTLPSDTLEANYGPRSAPGPMPDLAPTLPSDTLEATQPVDSFPTDPFVDDSASANLQSSDLVAPDASETAADSAAVRELQRWIERHPALVSPPPMRALLVKA